MKRFLCILLTCAVASAQTFASNHSRIQCKDLNNTTWTSDYASINAAYFFCGYKPTVQFTIQGDKATAVMELVKVKGNKMCDEIPTVYKLEGTCKDGEMYPLIIHAKDIYIRTGFNEEQITFWGSLSLFDDQVQGTLQSSLHQV